MMDWSKLKEQLLQPVYDLFDNEIKNSLSQNGIVFLGQVYLIDSYAFQNRLKGFSNVPGSNEPSKKVSDVLEQHGLATNFLYYGANRVVPDDGLADTKNIPCCIYLRDKNIPAGYDLISGNRAQPTQATIDGYFKSDYFQNERLKFENFLEDHKEYFTLIADPNRQVKIYLEKNPQMSAKVLSASDWILQNLPSELREGLSSEFLEAVLTSREVRSRIQEVVSSYIIQKLGLDQPN